MSDDVRPFSIVFDLTASTPVYEGTGRSVPVLLRAPPPSFYISVHYKDR